MSRQPLNSQDIVGLISKLKDSTPDYPTELLAARKASFLQQAVSINLNGNGLGGKGGGDGGIGSSGGTGGTSALGGLSTAQTILLQAVIGVWVIAAMLTAAYVFRDQIIDVLQRNGIVVETAQAPVSEPSVLGSPSPTAEVPTLDFTPTFLATTPGDSSAIEATPAAPSGVQSTPTTSKENPGLHLGQTPGSPDTPNQNKPDKTPKPDKQK